MSISKESKLLKDNKIVLYIIICIVLVGNNGQDSFCHYNCIVSQEITYVFTDVRC